MPRFTLNRAFQRRLMGLLLLFWFQPLTAEEFTLAVHPVLPTERTQQLYRPLIEYLSQATGHNITLRTSNNFLSHWQLMKRETFDLVLDGPHFTDYRVRKMGYKVLAKLPAVVSYSLVAHEDHMVLDPGELIGRKIATTPSPALGALRLAEIFPNPLRQPLIVETDDSETAAAKVLEGAAVAAIIPTPLVERYPQLTVVLTTTQVPSPGLSASPKLNGTITEAIRKALIAAPESEKGRAALSALNIAEFEPANADTFRGQRRLLAEMWGY